MAKVDDDQARTISQPLALGSMVVDRPISGPTGLNGLIEFSCLGLGQPFAAAVASLASPYPGAWPSASYGSFGDNLSLTWRPPF